MNVVDYKSLVTIGKHALVDNRTPLEKTCLATGFATFVALKKPVLGAILTVGGSFILERLKYKDIETLRATLKLSPDDFIVRRIGKVDVISYNQSHQYLIVATASNMSNLGNLTSIFTYNSRNFKTSLGEGIYAGLYKPNEMGSFDMPRPDYHNKTGHYLSVDGGVGCSYVYKGMLGVKFYKHYNTHSRHHKHWYSTHKSDYNDISGALSGYVMKAPDRVCVSTKELSVNSIEVITIGQGEEIAVKGSARIIIESDRKLNFEGISIDGVNCYVYPLGIDIIYVGTKIVYVIRGNGIFNMYYHFRLSNVYKEQDEAAVIQIWS